MSTIVVGVIINPNASKSGNEEEVQAEGKIGREREREAQQGVVCLFCLSQIVWRCCGVGVCEGAGLSLSLKPPWTSETSSKAQTERETEKDRQGRMALKAS